MRNKLLTTILVIMLVVATLPVSVFAENTEEYVETTLNVEQPGMLIDGEDQTTPVKESVDSLTASYLYNGTRQQWNVALTWTGSARYYNAWMDAENFSDASTKQGYIAGNSCTFSDVATGSHTLYVSTLDGSSIKSETVNIGELLKAYATQKAVRLEWEAVSNATGYVIKKSETVDGEYTTVAVIDNPEKNFYTDKVTDETQYYYVLCPYYGSEDRIMFQSAAVQCGRVRQMTIKFSFAEARTLTSHTGGSVKHKFKKGYTAEATGFAQGKYHFEYNGRTYYVTRISTTNHKVGAISKNMNYTKKEAECYVNKRGLKSNTKYLIWISTYTQREYIFTGSKGKWKAKYSWEISTGKPETPTRVGVTKIKKKVYERHDLHYWNLCSEFSIHNKANSWKLGYPRSGGCVRNTTDHAIWIYDNCPVGTAVCVY